MDEAQKQHPEMNLRCAECGHRWKARSAVYCLSCGSAELYQQAPWPAAQREAAPTTAEAKLPPPEENAA